ncbi:hypothetical protein ACFSKY_22425 [Azotobacter chroococcum]|uniref:Uncharacterized protein n=1 Tax=Azotobacter chroococcum TaxID=353 RepID=A0A4R1P1Q6_9GAMM|nr:hypothetical protein [Azotobacter chroococcum]TBV93950.1 hypothetical protein E0E53_15820 [Azotobacter chroococcum]TCL18579.1 hypothetical protein EV691_1465 [Azotobacter chroococcum]
MSLRDSGHRFCLSPDWQRARWLSPTIRSAMYPDWLDVTDMDSDELAELLIQKLLPPGPQECRAAQGELNL